jgi:hypothetical protein
MSKKPLIFIFCLITLLSFGYSLIYQIKPIVDAEAYDEIARNIVTYSTYKATIDSPIELDGAITRIGPGYEIFLASIYAFFGRHFWIIWLLQSILYALTIIMLSQITLKLFPELKDNSKYVYGAMIFFALLIDMIQLNAMLMTESLFLFLLTLSFYIWSKTFEEKFERNPWIWSLLGFILGLLILTRPTGLLIFALILGVSMYRFKRKNILALCLMTLVFILIQVPWVVRNYRIYHQFIFHSTADGMNILSGNYPGNHGEFNANFPFYKELREKYPSPIDLNTASKAWYRNFVIHHPIQALGVLIEKALILFSLAKTSGFWFHYFGKGDQIFTILLSIIENAIILGSILLFILHTFKKNLKEVTRRDLLIFLSLLILIATPIISVIANRHRLPLTVMSLPILSYILFILKNEWRKMIWKIIIVIVILGISTSIDVYLQFDKFKERINGVGSATERTNYV